MGFFDIFKKKTTTETPAEAGVVSESTAAAEAAEAVVAEKEQAELQAGLEKTKTGFFSKWKTVRPATSNRWISLRHQ